MPLPENLWDHLKEQVTLLTRVLLHPHFLFETCIKRTKGGVAWWTKEREGEEGLA